jgi:hypothetical protein
MVTYSYEFHSEFHAGKPPLALSVAERLPKQLPGRRFGNSLRPSASPSRTGFCLVAPDAVQSAAPNPQAQPPPSARIKPTVDKYWAAFTCSACRRLLNSLRCASSSSSWLTSPLR